VSKAEITTPAVAQSKRVASKRVEPVRMWLIEGRDGGGPVAWRAKVPFGRYSEGAIEELLRLLVARAELNFDEILGSTGRKRSGRSALLEVHHSFQPYALSCGSGWWFTARVVESLIDSSIDGGREDR
jgi:hypothetical protein